MQVGQTVLQSILYGLSEVLPISSSGHRFVVHLLALPSTAYTPSWALDRVMSLGVALAMGVYCRERLTAIVVGTWTSIAHRFSFGTPPPRESGLLILVAVFVAFLLDCAFAQTVSVNLPEPMHVGISMLFTGLSLATLKYAPRLYVQEDGASVVSSCIMGVLLGLTAFPGLSRMGVLLVFMLYAGRRPAWSLDFALILNMFLLILGTSRNPIGHGSVDLDAGTLLLGGLLAFLSAGLGCMVLKALVLKGRLAWLSLWVISLGLSVVAYARAL